MSLIADLIGGVTSGAFTGTIGAIVGPVFAYIKQKQDNKHELDMMGLQMEREKAGALHRLEETRTQMDGEIAKKVYDFARPDSTSAKWVRAINELVRPALTFWFFGVYAIYKLTLTGYSVYEGNPLAVAADVLWTLNDYQMLSAMFFFWFTDRQLINQKR